MQANMKKKINTQTHILKGKITLMLVKVNIM